MLDLLFESLVLQFCCLVFFFQFGAVGLASSAEHALQIFHCVSWLLGLLVKLNQNFGELIDCSCFFEVFFEFLFLALHAALTRTRITCDIISFIIGEHIRKSNIKREEEGGGCFKLKKMRWGEVLVMVSVFRSDILYIIITNPSEFDESA